MNELDHSKSKSETGTKKPYSPPTLVEYGRISKLVGKWGSLCDGNSGMLMGTGNCSFD
jgi:hypothetical protein